jgi:hypothetical protein
MRAVGEVVKHEVEGETCSAAGTQAGRVRFS